MTSITEASGLPNLFRSQPYLATAILFFAGSIVLLIAAVAYRTLGDEFSGDVLGAYESPRTVLNSVPGHPIPAIEERGALNIIGYRCVRGHKEIDVRLQVSFTNSETGTVVPYLVRRPDAERDERLLEQKRDAGCIDQTIQLILPERVMPGLWHVEGVEVTDTTGEIVNWYSEEFRVVPK